MFGGLLSPAERGLGFLLAPLQLGLRDRGTPCPCLRCPSSPKALPSESGTAPAPGRGAAGPGLRGSAPPARPGRAPTLNSRLLACSHHRPSRILLCCSPSRSVHCGSDRGSTGHRLDCGVRRWGLRTLKKPDSLFQERIPDTLQPLGPCLLSGGSSGVVGLLPGR